MPHTQYREVGAPLPVSDLGGVIRSARTGLRWTQAELGRRCGYSASQISRWETGAVPLRDVKLLRTLADVLGVPPAVFGLATGRDTAGRSSSPPAAAGHKVCRVTNSLRAEEDDPVRRRKFLHLTAAGGGALLVSASNRAPTAVDPASVLATRLGDVLLGPTAAVAPASVETLEHALAVARREFTGCRYLPLSERLAALITTAESTVAEHPSPQVRRVVAESYNLATRVLIKLEASGLEWLSADRALLAARHTEHPLTLAESQRLVASVARRAGHHERALVLTLAAADQLDVRSPRPDPEHLAMCGMLHLSAGYAAARAGDRDRAGDLLAEAETIAGRLADDADRHRPLMANLASHRVSAAHVLGDAGAALAHAHALPLAAIPTTERRARLLVDTAQAWAQWDKPDQAYRTLLAAERMAPGEVRTRNAVRRLVGDLLANPKQAAMRGLPSLAARIHAI
ncbi:helix-turn-helix domain-containing protein [Pseudonocardia acaciae]|uniref:helix-turn-helix domain-containing protein n=1 Tax=Pseudonocardia acaciae TaxID=551276 RepID=UPI000687C54B|nr:helix-turn-helix transcriptional regulator [Pseudonocardia acaciae]